MTQTAETIFHDARALEAEARGPYLDEACGGDHVLRARVEALLAADADAGSFLRTVPGSDPDATIEAGATPDERVGQMIGPFKLLEKIGEGGFGSVWAAEQREPVKRRVALKIIKLGMDTKQVIARFEAERQALAMMDHPNIAKVFDAGSTETGRPYFVMELVKGMPILEYCDREKLDTKGRLDLFTKVCHAIQHAHQKGIIHRDIKPGNVLVTLHDGVPVPKVIDFGIAKATNAELTEKTIYTQHHQMIGTPAYMSPEQAEMSGLDIDTRSDIYSLGVLLYELLTGTTPFDTQSLMEAGFAEMMRILREDEPHKPSTRLSSLGETGTRTAQQRRTDLKKLGMVLRGDLDWIVMKCLEKDRARRYDTANGLAADIQRHLSDEPVIAGPPSARYKLGKFVKRNKGQVIAGGVVSAVLVLGIVGTSTGMVWALSEKNRADESAAAEAEARKSAEVNEQKAVDEAKRAERELTRAKEIKRLITDMLTSVKPEEAKDADVTLLKGILDDAAARLKAGEITDGLNAAELHAVVGDVYWRLGLYPQAEEHLPVALEIRKRVLGAEHPDALKSMNNLANLYEDQGRYAEAEPLYFKTMEVKKRVLGEEHPSTLKTINNLAGLYWRQGRYAEAEPLYLETMEIKKRVLGEEHPSTLVSMNNLAILYRIQGRYAEAEPLNLKALEFQKRVLGDEHPRTLNSMNNLAVLYMDQGRYAEAEPLYLETLQMQKRVLGDEHPRTLASMYNLAILYMNQGRYAEAEPLNLKTLEIRKRVLGAEHPRTLNSMNNLAILYMDQGRYTEALPLLQKSLEIQKRILGDEHPDNLDTITNLGNLYNKMGRYEEAAKMFQDSLPVMRQVLGMNLSSTRSAMDGLAEAWEHLDRRDEAVALRRELLDWQTSAADKPDADARVLDETAQSLLDSETEELRDPARALGYATRACVIDEAAGGASLWQYLDTLALAQHRTGDTAAAVATQQRALDLMPDGADPEMADRLAEYQAALTKDDAGAHDDD
jgi:eukaryotic-like serine/threonine-protein kinase